MSAAAAGPVPRLRPYDGPALFSYGFRPFFLAGALYAGLAIPLWLTVWSGLAPATAGFAARDWHAHEMLYGYLAAVAAGFLLTAIPNWTGRLPLQGGALIGLVLLWLAGRVAMATTSTIGAAPAALIDMAFLVALAAACLREVIAGRNWRNLKVLGLIGLLIAGNTVFHVETLRYGAADYGARIGVAAAVMMLSLIGGRIVPSFTRNWLARRPAGRMPAPMGRADMAAIAASALALALWIAAPERAATGVALLLAGALQALRLARWAGERTAAEPLVLILHVAYAFLPAGFLLCGLAALGWAPASAGLHAFTAGAVGTMTLAVMTRASLGHTGRALAATRPTQAIYACVVVAALARIAAALIPAATGPLALVAGLCWSGAFLGFAAAYGPILLAPVPPRRDL